MKIQSMKTSFVLYVPIHWKIHSLLINVGIHFVVNVSLTLFSKMSNCPACRQSLTLQDFHPVTIRPFLNQLNQLLVKCKWCSQINIQRGNIKDHLKNVRKQLYHVQQPISNVIGKENVINYKNILVYVH